MVQHSVAVVLVSTGLLGVFGAQRDPGCGGAESPSSGLNAPCTRSKDCGSGLVCAEGVCTEPDSGMSGTAPPDGGRDAASGGDAANDGS